MTTNAAVTFTVTLAKREQSVTLTTEMADLVFSVVGLSCFSLALSPTSSRIIFMCSNVLFLAKDILLPMSPGSQSRSFSMATNFVGSAQVLASIILHQPSTPH